MNENDELLIEVLIDFERTANKLIQKLGEKYKLSLEDDHPFGLLISRQNNLWKGELDDNWNYKFHGDACQFYNNKTNQLLDVKINRQVNFGTIDEFYLFSFYHSIDSFFKLKTIIKTENEFHKVLSDLKTKNIIVNISDDVFFETNILNRKYYR